MTGQKPTKLKQWKRADELAGAVDATRPQLKPTGDQ
jgi:hypothetical protein